jgi:predicted MFS family arabinose efflux permease
VSTPHAPAPGPFASFAIPSYRYQWFSDGFSVWGAEMETIILAWYVLVQTDSGFLTAVVAALRFGGTLVAPFVGVVADRHPRRVLIIGMRASYLVLSASVVLVSLAGPVPLAWVFAVAGLGGLLRPSEQMLRQALIADTVPGALLSNALGLGRTTMESARVVGALTGGALLSWLGLGPAYLGVSLIYALAVLLSLRITVPADLTAVAPDRPLAALVLGLRHLRREPVLRTAILLAFAINLTGFPLSLGLLPVIARDVFGLDENGLARLSATVAAGTLVGAVLVAVALRRVPVQPLMLRGLLVWQLLIVAFAFLDSPAQAHVCLALIGVVTGLSMVAMSVLILRTAAPEFRGRIMGVRQLAVYGLPLGLLLAGALFDLIGIRATLLVLGLLGLTPVLVALIRTRGGSDG